ncbi:uncharacterized protein BX664DRAFT_298623 [Halteromyces radiatus]|uniref:uncharacterized protein n=1 Tax=Halteromyces radiatus TaxID=101107 RepID=UPI00221E70EB|nr:uncharacterized protein BX664DRAFT_298623 [Halteromyces radiatus]KAI8086169.1 hypothetical protein BX664DRAFT_298623 [Halteromyces radiatus]
MDPEYDPSHKTSSITSTNSWDTVPSLTASSVCDIDSPSLHDQSTFEDYSFAGDRVGLSIPFEEFPSSHEHDILNDNDQRTFTNFLDTFFIDGKPTHDKSSSSSHKPLSQQNTPIFLHQSHEITIPHSTNKETPPKPLLSGLLEPKHEPIDHTNAKEETTNEEQQQQQQQQEEDDIYNKQTRPSRDLLTEDEKRANHIASEQKRRNTIRNGFKEMTEIIPTLKNINNSKSTILFKAVEYIRHLDKRNRGLREKLSSLQIRLEVEGRMGGLIRAPHHLLRRHSHYYNEHQHKRSRSSNQQLPPEAMAALLAHKNQQKQLEMLQEQLRYQQELLAKHNIPTNGLGSRTSRHLSMDSSSLYNSISIPTDHILSSSSSSTSSPTTTSALQSSSLSASYSPSSSSTVTTKISSSHRRPSFVHSHHSHQHRSSAPALVMPNMIEDNWHSNHSSSTASPLGMTSFNIPADDDYSRTTNMPSKLHS